MLLKKFGKMLHNKCSKIRGNSSTFFLGVPSPLPATPSGFPLYLCSIELHPKVWTKKQ